MIVIPLKYIYLYHLIFVLCLSSISTFSPHMKYTHTLHGCTDVLVSLSDMSDSLTNALDFDIEVQA